MNNCMRFLKSGVLLIGLCLLANESFAFQRMGIQSGASVSVPPKRSGELSAFCLDENADPPTRGDSFSRVLNTSSPNDIVVQVGNRTLPLQDALDKGMVRIKGVSNADEVFARIDAVEIENLTKENIVVRANQTAVLGGKSNESFDYNVRSLLERHSSQDDVWRAQAAHEAQLEQQAAARSMQEGLKELGYYRGTIDGVDGPATRNAAKSFSEAHGLRGTKGRAASEAEIQIALQKSLVDVRERKSTADSGMLIVTVEDTSIQPSKEFYRIRTPHGDIVEDKSKELSGRISEYLSTHSAETVYLDVSSLPPHRIDALKTSLRLSGQAHLRIMENARLAKQTVRLLSSVDSKLLEVSNVTKSITGFEGRATLRNRVGTYALRVISKSKEAIEAFFVRLRQFLGSGEHQINLGVAVHRTRLEIKQRFGLTDEELQVEIGKEFDELDFVELPLKHRGDIDAYLTKAIR